MDNILKNTKILKEIEDAINDYYFALDTRQHGGIASIECLEKIQEIMGMEWTQGNELKKRCAIVIKDTNRFLTLYDQRKCVNFKIGKWILRILRKLWIWN